MSRQQGGRGLGAGEGTQCSQSRALIYSLEPLVALSRLGLGHEEQVTSRDN